MEKIGIFNVFFLFDGKFFLSSIVAPSINPNYHQVAPDIIPFSNALNFNSKYTNL
jgi:hypothetical protein